MKVIPLNTFIMTDMKNYILNVTALEEKYSQFHSITLKIHCNTTKNMVRLIKYKYYTS